MCSIQQKIKTSTVRLNLVIIHKIMENNFGNWTMESASRKPK